MQFSARITAGGLEIETAPKTPSQKETVFVHALGCFFQDELVHLVHTKRDALEPDALPKKVEFRKEKKGGWVSDEKAKNAEAQKKKFSFFSLYCFF